jgi:hypothetical protein
MSGKVGDELPTYGAYHHRRARASTSPSVMKLYTKINMKTNSEFVDRWRILIGGWREKFTKCQRKFTLGGIMNTVKTVFC